MDNVQHITATKLANPVNCWNSAQQILGSGHDNASGQNAPHKIYTREFYQNVVCISFATYLPKTYKIWQCCKCYKEAIQESISQKENEEFVVSKCHTIVDPWTMMVHFENTFSTHTAMVCTIRFNVLTFLTVPDCWKKLHWISNTHNKTILRFWKQWIWKLMSFEMWWHTI
jgi:hypothetical protein